MRDHSDLVCSKGLKSGDRVSYRISNTDDFSLVYGGEAIVGLLDGELVVQVVPPSSLNGLVPFQLNGGVVSLCDNEVVHWSRCSCVKDYQM